jgi:hypothetical protein
LSVLRECDSSERLVYSSAPLSATAASGEGAAAARASTHRLPKLPIININSTSSLINQEANKILAATRLFMNTTRDANLGYWSSFDHDLVDLTDVRHYVGQWIDSSVIGANVHLQRNANRRSDAALLTLFTGMTNPKLAFEALLSSLDPRTNLPFTSSSSPSSPAVAAADDVKRMERKEDASNPRRGVMHIASVLDTFRQIVAARYTLLRDLLHVSIYLAHVRTGPKGISLSFLSADIIPRLAALLKAYR